MAIERGYDSQVAPQAAPGPVLAGPDAYGAGIGRVMEQAGAQAHAGEIRAYQLERQAKADGEAADAAHKLAQARATMDDVQLQAQGAAGPGGAGYTETITKAWEAQRDAILGGITEDSVRRHVEQQFDEYGSRLHGQAAGWQEGQRIAKVTFDFKQSSNLSYARVLADPTKLPEEMEAANHAVEALQGINADQRSKLLDERHSELVQAHLLGGDPKVGIAELRSGAFDFLDPAHRQALESKLGVEVRAQDAEVQHQQAMARAAYSEQLATVKSIAGRGIEVPAEQIAPIRQAALASGDTSAVSELDGILQANGFSKIYRAMTPVAREQRLATLSGKKNPMPSEQEELAWGRQHASALDGEFNRDPVGYAAVNGPPGTTPPPVDFTQPQSLQARAAWSRQASQAYGRPMPIFSDNELQPLRATLAMGDRGRSEVLQALDALPGPDRALAARQVAPQDVGFQHEAQIQPFLRATVLAGRQKLRDVPRFLAPDKATEEGLRASQLLAVAGSEIDFALKAVSPADAAAVKQSAGEWLAGKLSGQGRDVNAITPGDMFTAALVALGGYSAKGEAQGGIGHWNGPGGKPYVVPDGFTRDGFARAVQVHRKGQDAAGAGPVNPNGMPFDLKNAYPVLIAPGKYRWETPGGGYVSKRGRDGRPSGEPYVTEVPLR